MRIRCFALTALAPTALVAVQLSSAHTRGRLALQAGTSVQSNYAGEPRSGGISGPELTRHLQEAVVGVRAKSHIWIDAGIYLSHIGQESWISRDGGSRMGRLRSVLIGTHSCGGSSTQAFAAATGRAGLKRSTASTSPATLRITSDDRAAQS